jgi:hypothetical protein
MPVRLPLDTPELFTFSNPPMDVTTHTDQRATDDRAKFLEKLATGICDRGYGTAAVFLLESVRPLNFIGSQVLYALGPVASLIIDQSKWEKMAEALEDRKTIEQLIRRIEAREHGSSPKS